MSARSHGLVAPGIAAAGAGVSWAVVAGLGGEPSLGWLPVGAALAFGAVWGTRLALEELTRSAEGRLRLLLGSSPPGVALGLMWLAGAFANQSPLARAFAGLGLLGCLLLAGLVLWPLLALGALESERHDSPPARWTAGAKCVLILGATFQLVTAWAVPPLIQIDSVANLHEPGLLEFRESQFHHTPLYVSLVKACAAWDLSRGLWLLTALQQALIIGMGLAMERALRVTAGPVLAALAGVAIVTDPGLAVYGRSVMTEVPSTALLVASVVLLWEARRRRPRALLFASGLCAAGAVLTKQAFQLWWPLATAWVLWSGSWAPRPRAAGVFAAGAVIPLLLLMSHNYVFQGRGQLTAALGRALLYRVVYDMPPLTDPAASPEDEMEQARRIIWDRRDEVWQGPYQGLRTRLGWSDDRIDAAVRGFYWERVRDEPLRFTWVTFRYARDGALAPTPSLSAALDLHEQVLAATPAWGGVLARGAGVSVWQRAAEWLDLPRRWAVLVLLGFAPLLGGVLLRRDGLLCLLTAAYVIGVPALAQIPLERFRIPAIPFVLTGAALGLHAVGVRLRRTSLPPRTSLA